MLSNLDKSLTYIQYISDNLNHFTYAKKNLLKRLFCQL